MHTLQPSKPMDQPLFSVYAHRPLFHHIDLALSAQQQAPLTQLLSNRWQNINERPAPTASFVIGAVRAGQPLSYFDRRWQDLQYERPPSDKTLIPESWP